MFKYRCWGMGYLGRLDEDVLYPSTSITSGFNHDCVIDIMGRENCWGDDDWGQCAINGSHFGV